MEILMQLQITFETALCSMCYLMQTMLLKLNEHGNNIAGTMPGIDQAGYETMFLLSLFMLYP